MSNEVFHCEKFLQLRNWMSKYGFTIDVNKDMFRLQVNDGSFILFKKLESLQIFCEGIRWAMKYANDKPKAVEAE